MITSSFNCLCFLIDSDFYKNFLKVQAIIVLIKRKLYQTIIRVMRKKVQWIITESIRRKYNHV